MAFRCIAVHRWSGVKMKLRADIFGTGRAGMDETNDAGPMRTDAWMFEDGCMFNGVALRTSAGLSGTLHTHNKTSFRRHLFTYM